MELVRNKNNIGVEKIFIYYIIDIILIYYQVSLFTF